MTIEQADETEWANACSESLVLLDVVESMAPGADLAAACAELSARPMCAQGQVRLAALWLKVETWTTVARWRSQLHAVQAAGNDGLLMNAIVAELAVTTSLSEATVNRHVSDAYMITVCLPVMTAALEAGALTISHGKALESVVHGVPTETISRVDARIVPLAVAKGWTPYQLKQAALRYLLRIDPDGCAERAAERKKADSDVTYRTLGDGLAELHATGDDVLLRQVKDAVDATAGELMAAAAGKHDDPVFMDRRVGEHRVEALARLVLGDKTVDKPTVQVLVTMTAGTLLGLCDTPAVVSGVGPIPAAVARRLASDGTWRRLLTDPTTGHLVDLGMTAYRPSAALKRIVLATNGSCRFPGCGREATDCDIDHRQNYGDGGTDRNNLGPLCRRHHNLKTFGLWNVERHPDGSESWTSPHGFERTTTPVDYRELADRDPDPGPDAGPDADPDAIWPPIHLVPDPAALAAIVADGQDFDPWNDPHDEGWTLVA